MVLNPNAFAFGSPVGQSNYLTQAEEPAGFFESVGLNYGLEYDHYIETARNAIRFGFETQEGYDPFNDMTGYEQYADHLYFARSPEHMVELKRFIDESQARRERLGTASLSTMITAGLVSGIVDPVNLVTLPFGGPAVGVGRSVLRGAASVGAIQVGLEAGRQTFDPVATIEETTFNIGSAMVFGGVFGGAMSVPITRRAQAMARQHENLSEEFRQITAIQNVSSLTARDLELIGSRELRDLGGMTDDGLRQGVAPLQRRMTQLESQPASPARDAQIEQVASDIRMFQAETAIREIEGLGYTGEQLWRYADNIFMRSPVYRAISSPFKSILQSDWAPASLRSAAVRLASDRSNGLVLNRLGLTTGASVFERSAMRNGEWVMAHTSLMNHFRDSYQIKAPEVLDINPTRIIRNTMGSEDSYDNWLRRINQHRVNRTQGLSAPDQAAVKVLDDYFKKMEVEAESVGLMGSRVSIENDLRMARDRIDALEQRLRAATRKKDQRIAGRITERLKQLRSKEAELDDTLKNFSSANLLPGNAEPFFPRFWNTRAIEARRQDFANILRKWYTQNPRVWDQDANGKWVQNNLLTTPDAIDKRVERTILRILGEDDEYRAENITFGHNRSRHFRHRELDIPNSMVMDFIEQNPIAAMKMYSHRVVPQIEFRKQFGGSFDDLWFDIETDMLSRGLSDKNIDAARRDLGHLYDRVAGVTLRNPNALNRQAANVMKSAAELNYMGSSGFSAITEFGRIIGEHDLGDIIKSLWGMATNSRIRMQVKEIRAAGEAVDLLKGQAYMRFSEQIGNDVTGSSLWSKARNSFYTLNLLGPITQITKNLDGIVRAHTILDRSIRAANGQADEFELTWLARYNINQDMAKRIAAQPHQDSNTLRLANTEAWTDAEARDVFRSAMNTGIINTIVHGTPADRPIITDGVVYVPMRVARRFGYSEDRFYKGYARIENGLLSLPFQFLNFTLGSLNKTLASASQGQLKNKTLMFSSMMGLAYMSLSIKTPDERWQEMTWQDTFARTFDQSGIMALYSDLFYRSMTTVGALTGVNPTGDFLQPKFPVQRGMEDFATTWIGAGPNITWDILSNGLGNLAEGDYGQGFMHLTRNLPFARYWFWKDQMNEMTRSWAYD